MTEDRDPTAAASITALVKAELVSEVARKASLEQRGLGIVTSSGTLLTLVFALLAAARGGPLHLNSATRIPLFTSLPAFVLAAACGIAVNWTWKTAAVPVEGEVGLRAFLNVETFDGPAKAVDRRVAEVHVAQVGTLRRVNNAKATLLQTGLVLEITAILGVAVVAGIELM